MLFVATVVRFPLIPRRRHLGPALLLPPGFFHPIDLPILFDRQHRKVSTAWRDLDETGHPKQRGAGIVIEHDWDDIVAEHHVSTTTTGSSAQRHHTWC